MNLVNSKSKLSGDLSYSSTITDNVESQTSTGTEAVFGVEEVLNTLTLAYTTDTNITNIKVFQERTGTPPGSSILRIKIKRGGLNGITLGSLDITTNTVQSLIVSETDVTTETQLYSLIGQYPGATSSGSSVPTYDSWNGFGIVFNINDTHYTTSSYSLP